MVSTRTRATLRRMDTNAAETATTKLLDSLSREEIADEINEVQRRMAELSIHLEFLQLGLRLKEARSRRHVRGEDSGRVVDAATVAVSEASPGAERPQLKTAVLLAMRETPGKVWTPAELYTTLAARGWAPQTPSAKTQVSNALQRLRAVATGQKGWRGPLRAGRGHKD